LVEIGDALSSEAHPASDLVRHAALAERVGFTFALVSELIQDATDDQVGAVVSCGPDPQAHLEKIAAYADGGCGHQIGPDQRGFIEFAARELMPALVGTAAEPATAGAR
jgi:hypothetical protein